jgi:hypothetical protein
MFIRVIALFFAPLVLSVVWHDKDDEVCIAAKTDVAETRGATVVNRTDAGGPQARCDVQPNTDVSGPRCRSSRPGGIAPTVC